MFDLDYEIGFAELALVEVAGGTLVSEFVLDSVNETAITLIAQAEARIAFDIAGAADSSLLISAISTSSTAASGTSVFTAETLALVNATLAAAGSATVFLVSESDPEFDIVGTSTVAFASQVVRNTAFDAAGEAAVSLLGSGVSLLSMTAAGSSVSTLLGAAYAEITLTASGIDGFNVAGQAIGAATYSIAGQTNTELLAGSIKAVSFAATGSSDTTFSIDKLAAGNMASVGQSFVTLAGASTKNTAYAFTGTCNTNFINSSYYDELPRAWDYVIREYELRGIIREYEDRTALYN